MEGESIYKQQQQQQQQPPTDTNSQGEAEINLMQNQKCPRCDSVNTRFCYFNNHKTSQPRYICKNCKRFWTLGGNVRNIRSNRGEQRMKRARGFSSSGGSAKDFPSTAISQPSPPLTVVSPLGIVRRVGTLNYTRPQAVVNQPPLKFVRVDINSLLPTQGSANRVLNPYMASPQAQGQGYPVQPNGQNPIAGTSYYPEPGNGNILWESSNQIGHSRGGLSGSSSRAWSAELPRYGTGAYLA